MGETNRLRQPYSSEEVENNWAISYGDMITLLLAFFVLFFNIKSTAVHLKLIKSDIDNAFSTQPKALDKPGPGPKWPVVSSDIRNQLKINSNLQGERLLIEFPEISFFKSGSSGLTKAGKEALKDFSQVISPHKGQFRMVVRGYTDGQALRRTSKFRDNLELSAFRSLSAIRYLHKQGLTLSSMRIAGYGEANAFGHRKASHARKVVIVIEPLDHTEKLLEGTGKTSPKAVEKSSLKLRDTASANKPKISLWRQLVSRSRATAIKSQEEALKGWTGVSKGVSNHDFYQWVLREQLEVDLQERGHSLESARASVDNFMKEREEQQ